MTTAKIIAKRIRLARIEREMKQIDLADALGTTQGYITKIESGKVNIGVDTLARLSTILHKPAGWFFEPFDEDAAPFAESPGAGARKHKATH